MTKTAVVSTFHADHSIYSMDVYDVCPYCGGIIRNYIDDPDCSDHGLYSNEEIMSTTELTIVKPYIIFNDALCVELHDEDSYGWHDYVSSIEGEYMEYSMENSVYLAEFELKA